VDLNHSFTVPASLDETWRTFEDIESVAGCFPGAVVTSVEGPDFKGTCKVKLGPIAMVYSGTGTFLEKDESARKFVIEAKGKDKRGNGTAGALVTASLADEGGGSTRVDVHTDLAITGKPAQFGRGVIEDISNKLLQQFVTCLQDRVGASPAEEPADESPVEAEPVAAAESAVPTTGSAPQAAEPEQPAPVAAPRTPPRPQAAGSDEALDLGATVLPILARTYGPQAGIALLALLIGYLLGRRRG
jgi:carbon monoxide dehydrogenase subunit G